MNPRPYLVQRLLLSAFLWPAFCVAQTSAALSERDWLEELPVVLSVSRLAQPLSEAPGAVTVIDRETIRRSGVRHVADLLRLVPGFQVMHIPNGQPVATYHGLSEDYPRHLQVLLDGRSQYSPFFLGGVNWNLLPVSLDDIERIEVVRGSNSAAYGSNAFLGLVNIVTRHAADTHGVALESRSGTQGVRDGRVRVGTGNHDFHVRLTADAVQDAGFEFWKDDRRQRLFDLRADWRLGVRDELQLQAGEIVTDLDVGSGSASNPQRGQRLSQSFLAASWRRALDAGDDVALRYYRSEERGSDAFHGTYNGDPMFVDYGYRSTRNNLEATHTFSPWRDARIVWGGEYRTDEVVAPLWYASNEKIALTVARAFGNLEWRPLPAVTTNVGGTWERDTNSKTTFAPRAAVNWHLTPAQTLRVGAARAYRAPSLYEARGNAVFMSTAGVVIRRHLLADGSPLLPESVISREIGWIGEFRSIGLTADVRLFEERIADRIIALETALPVPLCNPAKPGSCFAVRGYNAQDVRIRGAEYQLRWHLGSDTRALLNQAFVRLLPQWRLDPYGNAALFEAIKARETNLVANSAPTHVTTLMLMQRLPGGIDASVTYQSVGAMQTTTNRRVPAWHRLDWRLGYPFRLGATKGEINYTVQSDGTPHAEYGVDAPVTRRGYVGLLLEF